LERGSREHVVERGSETGHSAQSSDSGVPLVRNPLNYLYLLVLGENNILLW
jgi:hypothetical protein